MEDKVNVTKVTCAIARAVEAAGGPVAVAYKLGLTNSASVVSWIKSRSIPAGHISTLCALGENVVKPQEILDQMAERTRNRNRVKDAA